MTFLGTLREKSWEPATAEAATTSVPGPRPVHDAQRLMLNIFLVVISMVFLLFLITFISHSQYDGFQPLAGEPWMPLSDASRLWFNTLLLGLSSVAIHSALIGARRNSANVTVVGMVLAVFFAVQFVLAQLWLWREMSGLGYTLSGNPANSYFYLLTAVHGLHLAGGLAVMFRTIALVWRGAGPEQIRPSLALTTRYWHYLFGLWLVLFGLLASPPEVYDAIAAACGLDG